MAEKNKYLVGDRRYILRKHVSEFRSEFNRQLALFITGAFSFVAALLWNTAIQKIIVRYQADIVSVLPIKEGYAVDLTIAFVVSIVAVVAIILISKILGVKK